MYTYVAMKYIPLNTVSWLVKFPGPAAFIALTCIIYSTSVINEGKLMLVFLLLVNIEINDKSDDTLYCTSYDTITPFCWAGGFHVTVKVSGLTPTFDAVKDKGGPATI